MKKFWIKLALIVLAVFSLASCTVTKYQYNYYPDKDLSVTDSVTYRYYEPNKVY